MQIIKSLKMFSCLVEYTWHKCRIHFMLGTIFKNNCDTYNTMLLVRRMLATDHVVASKAKLNPTEICFTEKCTGSMGLMGN